MKYGLLVGKTLSNGSDSGVKNIGDYIQNLAALQYLPKVDEYIDRDGDNPGNEPLKIIMNAWYTWNPDKFPLDERYIPLPISMHISPSISDELLNKKEVISWFKKNEPIGCRDYGTVRRLAENNIKAYFSGCLTLTLGRKYKNKVHSKQIVFVDPYLGMLRHELNIKQAFEAMFYSMFHLSTYIKVFKKFQHHLCEDNKLHRRIFYSAVFLKTYSNMFSRKELADAKYITHHEKVGEGTRFTTEESKLTLADQYVREYAHSGLVITSRIHCALPCLAVDTPVLFVQGSSINEKSQASSAGRFEGLIELLNVAEVKGLNFLCDFDLKTMKNKKDYLQIAKKLEEECLNFIYDK